jgi:hypothetical protein
MPNPWVLLAFLLLLIGAAGGGVVYGHHVGEDAQAATDNVKIATLNTTISTMQQDAAAATIKHDVDVAAAEHAGQDALARQIAEDDQELQNAAIAFTKSAAALRAGTSKLRIKLAAGSCSTSSGVVPQGTTTTTGSNGANTAQVDGSTAADLGQYAVADVNAIIGNLTKLQDYATTVQTLCNGK